MKNFGIKTVRRVFRKINKLRIAAFYLRQYASCFTEHNFFYYQAVNHSNDVFRLIEQKKKGYCDPSGFDESSLSFFDTITRADYKRIRYGKYEYRFKRP